MKKKHWFCTKGFCCSAGTYLEIYSEHLKFQETLRDARHECQRTLYVSDDEVRHYKLDNNTYSDGIRCFAKCVFEKLEMFSTTDFNVENSIERFRVAMKEDNMISIRERVVKCANDKLETETACERANRGFECFTKEGLSLG